MERIVERAKHAGPADEDYLPQFAGDFCLHNNALKDFRMKKWLQEKGGWSLQGRCLLATLRVTVLNYRSIRAHTKPIFGS